jgi:hypothetical protein
MEREQNKKMEEILSSLDGVNRAVVPDFFYTRLKARMEARLQEGQAADPAQHSWALRPAYAVAALVLVLVVNSFVLLQKKNNSSAGTGDTETIAIQSIAAEYRLNDNNNSLYDFNQDK